MTADIRGSAPWTVECRQLGPGDLFYGRYYIRDEDDQEIASVHGETDKEAELVARLMAAAPEMVEALRAALPVAEHLLALEPKGARVDTQIRRALEKAGL